jgi:hypothetical protein
MSCGDGWTAWCLAENGGIERFYAVNQGTSVGFRHAAEERYLLPDEDDGLPDDAYAGINFSDSEAFAARWAELKEQYAIPDTAYATDIAARTSIDPTTLSSATRVQGRAVLALTAGGRTHGVAPGALSI